MVTRLAAFFGLIGIVALAACASTTEPTPPPATQAVPPPAAEPARKTLAAAEGQIEYWGVFRGEPVWLRLKPKADGARWRALLIQYTPPTREELAGTTLSDHPTLKVDEVARILHWSDGERTLSSAVWKGGERPGYAVICERERRTGDDLIPVEDPREIPGGAAWDRRLAPVLLPLVWQAKTRATVPAVDLFGGAAADRASVSWEDRAVTIAGASFTIDVDPQGRLSALRDATGSVLLRIDGWSVLTTAQAMERDVEAQRRLEARSDPAAKPSPKPAAE